MTDEEQQKLEEEARASMTDSQKIQFIMELLLKLIKESVRREE